MKNKNYSTRSIWTVQIFIGTLVLVLLCLHLLAQDNSIPAPKEPLLASAAGFSAFNHPDIIKYPDEELILSQRHQPTSSRIERLEQLARNDHIALLKWSLENYQKNIRDYTTSFSKQERINGKLKPIQEMSVCFKEQPFSLLMEWEKNAGVIDKLLYVEGSYDNQMIVHPTGIFSWVKSVKRQPDCKKARESNLRTCDQFGFARNLKNLLRIYDRAQKKNDLRTNFLGINEVLGRRCITIERILPPRKNYPDARMVINLDVENLLPIDLTSYDWQGNLISRYTYGDLKVNTGLTDNNFLPQTNQL